MKNILVIGATGYIGSAVSDRLAKKGYTIVGLVHSESSREKLAALGYETIAGDMLDPASLTNAVQTCDAVIHCGGIHGGLTEDDMVKLSENDRMMIEAIVKAIDGTKKRYLHTTGATVFAEMSRGEWSDQWHDDDDDYVPPEFIRGRYHGERYLLAKDGQHQAHTMVIRPGIVHGHGGSLFTLGSLQLVKGGGVSAYLGKGENRLGFLHLDDLADLYVLALEKGAPGAAFNAATQFLTGRTVADIHRRACRLKEPSASWSWERMMGQWQFALTMLMSANELMNCRNAYDLGWRPGSPNYEQDVIYGSYAG